VSVFRTLRGKIEGLAESITDACCRQKISPLRTGRAHSFEEKSSALANWLEKLHARGAFSGSVLIAKSGKILFEKHHGFTDIGEAVPIGPSASFSIASISKQFTGMGILLLATRGKLGLDDRLEKYISELADYGEVTIRQLLHHTSGIPDHAALAAKHWDREKILTTPDMIALLRQYRPPLTSPPGEKFEYSNTGYVLLGEIIARVSRMTYATFMDREILKPLRMHNSAVFNLASRKCTLSCRVFGMRKRFVCFGKKQRADLNYLDGVFGDAGIYTTAEDLLRWDRGLHNGTLLPMKKYAEAYVSGTLNNGKPTDYGFGWEIRSPYVVDHFGEWEGFTAYLRRDLKTETCLVILSNLGPPAYVQTMAGELEKFVEGISAPAST
jgi:CubicO group peptidase (beta-lactamase class C family)